MTDGDIKLWLYTNGVMVNDAYDGYIGSYHVIWKAHYGFNIVGCGGTRERAYRQIYNDIKESIFECCV